jgi:small-conductance mechanosensitive channel
VNIKTLAIIIGTLELSSAFICQNEVHCMRRRATQSKTKPSQSTTEDSSEKTEDPSKKLEGIYQQIQSLHQDNQMLLQTSLSALIDLVVPAKKTTSILEQICDLQDYKNTLMEQAYKGKNPCGLIDKINDDYNKLYASLETIDSAIDTEGTKTKLKIYKIKSLQQILNGQRNTVTKAIASLSEKNIHELSQLITETNGIHAAIKAKIMPEYEEEESRLKALIQQTFGILIDKMAKLSIAEIKKLYPYDYILLTENLYR